MRGSMGGAMGDELSSPAAVAAAGLAAAGGGGGEGDFVPAPQKVAKIEIGYARKAKQVDIKALKENVWWLLQDEAKKGEKGGKGKAAAPREVSFQTYAWPASNRQISEVGCRIDESSLAPFGRVVGRLHERVPADKLHEVSFAYCFICLLHLANEKSLEVLGEGDMRDMRVRLPA